MQRFIQAPTIPVEVHVFKNEVINSGETEGNLERRKALAAVADAVQNKVALKVMLLLKGKQ